MHWGAGSLERAKSRLRVELGERHPRVAEIGGAPFGEQAGSEDLHGQGQRGLGGIEVQRWERDQVPQGLDRRGGLPVLREPRAERAPVEPRIVRIQAGQRQGRTHGSDPIERSEERVAR